MRIRWGFFLMCSLGLFGLNSANAQEDIKKARFDKAISCPNGGFSHIFTTSRDGSIITGNCQDETGLSAFIWEESTGLIFLDSSVRPRDAAISKNGQYIGGSAANMPVEWRKVGEGEDAFYEMFELPLLGSALPESYVYQSGSVNHSFDGGFVGNLTYRNGEGVNEVFSVRWEGGIITLLSVERFGAAAASDDGSIIVGWTVGETISGAATETLPSIWTQQHGYQTKSEMPIRQGIGRSVPLPSSSTFALSINL